LAQYRVRAALAAEAAPKYELGSAGQGRYLAGVGTGKGGSDTVGARSVIAVGIGRVLTVDIVR
jgi:hypothetical protein